MRGVFMKKNNLIFTAFLFIFSSCGNNPQEPPIIQSNTIVEEYYNFLQAPHKELIWFDQSAHNMVFTEAEKTNRELIRIARDILKASNPML